MNCKIGLYEKALPSYLSWKEKLLLTRKYGYDFLEISIDESDEKIHRLQWSAMQKKEIKDAIDETGVHILTMCLSGNRKYTIGSEDPEKRKKGIELIKSAIRFCVDIGIRIIQLASYDEYYNDRNLNTEMLFLEGLIEVTKFAAANAVTLAFETMDTDFIDSIHKAMKFVEKVNSPWLQIYPDIANITACGKSKAQINEDFLYGLDHIVAIHLKDSKNGEIRRIPFGAGIVDFEMLFKLLQDNNFCGLFVTEMWSDDKPNAIDEVKNARMFLEEKMLKVVNEVV